MGVNGFAVMFAVVGPFLIQDVLHYNAIVFGHTALFLGLSFLLGSYCYRFLLRHVSLSKIILMGTLLAIIVDIVFLILAAKFSIHYWSIVIPVIVIYFAIGCSGLYQSGSGLCISLFPAMAGAASSVSAVVYFIVLGLSGSVASLLQSDTAMPLAIAYLALFMVCFLVFVIVLRRHFNKPC